MPYQHAGCQSPTTHSPCCQPPCRSPQCGTTSILIIPFPPPTPASTTQHCIAQQHLCPCARDTHSSPPAMAAPMRSALRGSRSSRTLSSKSPSLRRRLTVFSPARAQVRPVAAQQQSSPILPPTIPSRQPQTSDIQTGRPATASVDGSATAFFDSSGIFWVSSGGGEQPPDPNKAKLGKSEFLLNAVNQSRVPSG